MAANSCSRTSPTRARSGTPRFTTFVPADQFDIHGTYVARRTTKDGLGAPLVAIGRKPRGDYRETFSMAHVYYGVTALARFDGRRCVLSFEDPLNTETVRFGGASFPLAADFTVPLAVMLAKENPKKLELTRLLRPEKYAETAHVARLQPYDPSKTVVLVIHGLMDSPRLGRQCSMHCAAIRTSGATGRGIRRGRSALSSKDQTHTRKRSIDERRMTFMNDDNI